VPPDLAEVGVDEKALSQPRFDIAST